MIFIKRGGSMKKVNKFKYKRVRLYWQDIVSNPEWLTLSKAKDQVYSWCEDTGYLLHKDQKKVIIKIIIKIKKLLMKYKNNFIMIFNYFNINITDFFKKRY